MATEYVCDDGDLDGNGDWDTLTIGQHSAIHLLGQGGAAARGGVIPAQGDPLKVVPAAGMHTTLLAGRFWAPSAQPVRGGVPMVLPSNLTLDHETTSSTNPRIDLVAVVFNDVGTSASFKKFMVITGTEDNAVAEVPPLPSVGQGSAWALAAVHFDAGATTATSIEDLRTWAGVGGTAVHVKLNAEVADLPRGAVFFSDEANRFGGVANGPPQYFMPETFRIVTGRFNGQPSAPDCLCQITHNLGDINARVVVQERRHDDIGSSPILGNIRFVETNRTADSVYYQCTRTDTFPNIPFRDNVVSFDWHAIRGLG